MAIKIEPKVEAIDPVLLLTPPKKKPSQPEISAGDKAAAVKSITDFKRASAWSLHRWPLGSDGIDVQVIWPGMDLNQVIHQYYYEEIVNEGKESSRPRKGKVPEQWKRNASNFVAEDNIQARRHEYLGPDPRVAGYRLDVDGDIHIQWWDSFLHDQWLDKQKWKVEVKLDDDGKVVEKDRY